MNRTEQQIEQDVREGRDPVLAEQRAKIAFLEGRRAFEARDWPTMHQKVDEEQYWKDRFPQPPIDLTCMDDPAPCIVGGGQAVVPSDGHYVSGALAASLR